MSKRIIDTGPTLKTIYDTGPKLPRVDPAQVAIALGAEPCEASVGGPFGPINRLMIRQEIFRQLQANGGKLDTEEPNPVVQLNKKTWNKLKKLAADVSLPDFAPSPSQLGNILLSLCLQSMEVRSQTK